MFIGFRLKYNFFATITTFLDPAGLDISNLVVYFILRPKKGKKVFEKILFPRGIRA